MFSTFFRSLFVINFEKPAFFSSHILCNALALVDLSHLRLNINLWLGYEGTVSLFSGVTHFNKP